MRAQLKGGRPSGGSELTASSTSGCTLPSFQAGRGASAQPWGCPSCMDLVFARANAMLEGPGHHA